MEDRGNEKKWRTRPRVRSKWEQKPLLPLLLLRRLLFFFLFSSYSSSSTRRREEEGFWLAMYRDHSRSPLWLLARMKNHKPPTLFRGCEHEGSPFPRSLNRVIPWTLFRIPLSLSITSLHLPLLYPPSLCLFAWSTSTPHYVYSIESDSRLIDGRPSDWIHGRDGRIGERKKIPRNLLDKTDFYENNWTNSIRNILLRMFLLENSLRNTLRSEILSK